MTDNGGGGNGGRRLPYPCPHCTRTFAGVFLRDEHVEQFHENGRSPCAHRPDAPRPNPTATIRFNDGFVVPGDVRREAARLWRAGVTLTDISRRLGLTRFQVEECVRPLELDPEAAVARRRLMTRSERGLPT